jgi:DnaK suppressor protein
MDSQTLEQFKIRLTGMLSELEGEVSVTVEGMRDGQGAFPDPNDRATLESDRNLTLRIRDRERKLRSKVEEALARIVDGSFGLCEECGEEIGVKRLEARPVTTLCVKCKSSQEDKEIRHHTA